MKKYLPYILIGVMAVGILGLFGVHRAHAGFLEFLSAPGQAVKTLAAWIVYLILTLVSQLLTIVGFFFERAVEYSINLGKSGTLETVKAGWETARNFANLFFIFILLYIAIATILQIAGYGMKELLVKVIIIALLVNFSLVITKVVIDASNILALEFYNDIKKISVVDEGGSAVLDADGNPKTVRLSEAIVNGIQPQRLYFNDQSNVFKDSQDQTLMQIITICVFGIIILLIMSFLILAAGFLFVIRTAVLWLLMILAPLAFLFMALPKTQQYANKWWNTLFNQAFFAPAYLFLLYLAIKIISGGNLLKDLNATNTKYSSAFLSPDYASVQLILNFAIIIVLMIFCLIVSKQMGAYGAGAAMKWGEKARKWGQGYAGKISKRGAGYVAEKTLDEESRFGKTKIAGVLRGAPLVGRGLAGASSWRKKQMDEEMKKYEKFYGSFSDAGLKELKERPGRNVLLSSQKRKAIENVMTKRAQKEVKKEDLKKEDDKYKKIQEELPKMEEWNKTDKTRKIEISAELEMNRSEMQRRELSDTEKENLKKKTYQLLLEQEQIEERIKEVNQMREEKKKIEENRERRREIGELEERVAKTEAVIEGAKKPKEAEPKKT